MKKVVRVFKPNSEEVLITHYCNSDKNVERLKAKYENYKIDVRDEEEPIPQQSEGNMYYGCLIVFDR